MTQHLHRTGPLGPDLRETKLTRASPPRDESRKLHCSEIWGGYGQFDDDISVGPVTVSLISAPHEGKDGGDIYYFSLCEDDAIVRIAVADVVGHGEAVSRVSRWIYGALAAKMNSIDGDEILVELNALVHRVGLDAMTTAAVLSFQRHESTLYVSYAGHPPVWLRRGRGGAWRPIELENATRLANVVLGAFPEVGYDRQAVLLEPGDRLMVHTDGLTEAMSESGEPFGADGLQSVLEEGAADSPDGLKNRLLRRVRAHTGGTLGDDDLTLVVAEIR